MLIFTLCVVAGIAVYIGYRAWLMYESLKLIQAVGEAYVILSLEPMLQEEALERVRRVRPPHITRLLNGTPFVRFWYFIESRGETFNRDEMVSNQFHFLLELMEEHDLVKLTESPVTVHWLEFNKHRLSAVPFEELERWKMGAYLLHTAPPHNHTITTRRCVRCRCEDNMHRATLVQKLPRGRRTPSTDSHVRSLKPQPVH